MEKTIECDLCPFSCGLAPGQVGKCKVRGNVDGEITLLTYGRVSTMSVGPIEQKPLYHFHPGASILSIGGAGCNMRCSYCQNFEISQVGSPPLKNLAPKEVVEVALQRGVAGIAFTYSEPVVWYEYVIDVAKLARKAGLKTVLKTNGYACTQRFEVLCMLMDAVNIDVKGGPRAYRYFCGVDILPKGECVLFRNMEATLGLVHLEVSVLAVPGYEDELEELFFHGMDLLPRSVPIHILKFVPDFKMKDRRSFSDGELEAIAELAKEAEFQFVYIHCGGPRSVTECYACGEEVAVRLGLEVIKNSVTSSGCCPACGQCLNFG